MKKALKIAGKVLAVFIILNILGAIIIYTYFKQHKKEIMQKASIEIGEKIKASVHLKDAEISWFGTFPYLSLVLQDVNITDSAYSKRPIPFLEAGHFFVSVDMFKLIRGNFHINRVLLSDGIINLIRDSSGESNLHILDEKNVKKEPQKPPSQTLFNFMTLNNIRVFVVDKSEQKKYDLVVKHLTCESDFDDTVTSFKIDMNMHVNYLGLNILDGYYGKNKDLGGSFKLYLNSKAKTLTLNKIKIYLNTDPVIADGVFNLDTAKHFKLHISAKAIDLENARGALLEKTQISLAPFKTSKPVDIEADMHGDTKYLSIPHVTMTWTINDDEITTPGGKFEHCSMAGNFMNEANPALPRNDTNSRMTVTGFDGLWNGSSRVHSNKIVVTNLIHPLLHFDLQASCKLTDIDSLVQSNDVNLEEGTAKIDITYDGALNDSACIVPDITGAINLANAEVLYVPRNMRLKKCNATIAFNHSEVSINNLSGRLGNSSIVINGHVNSFAPLFAHNNKEMWLQWNIASPLIDLTQLVPLISGRQHIQRSKKSQQKSLAGISSAIDSFAEKCNVQATMNVKKIVYKHFEADNLNADLSLNNRSGWKVRNLELNHSGGKITLKGNVVQMNDEKHLVKLDVDINSVDVSKIFYAFDNFGMTSFNSTNLKGKASLVANLQLELNNKADIVPNSLKGEGEFSLLNGELIDFKPIEEICAKVFPARNFKDIQFAELKDKFSVANYKIKLNKMEIASNFLHMYIDGTYALKGNATDLIIQVPVNNLATPDYNNAPDNKGVNAKKGLSVYIKAVDDGKGTVVFKYSFSGKHIKQSTKPQTTSE